MSLVNKMKSLGARATMAEEDIRALLAKDHEEVKALAKEMHETASPLRRTSLLGKLKPALTAHARAEEKVVYDALLRVRANDASHELGDEGYVEHSLVDELLTTLASTRAATERWKATAKVLHELLEHHIQEEESDVFALLGDHYDRDELQAMGAQFKRMKADILRAPSATSKRGTQAASKQAASKQAASKRRAPAKGVRRAASRTSRPTRKSSSKKSASKRSASK
jgi:hemerythrin superfamily protein